ncbi:hypothetical protein FKX85_13650 [Echinicola soli]|uniref:CHRD domain-containing protein n=1 Tax=Echinicola soli TaxID=2591634 RepID=A0A514CJR1_9BACT|nr:CHRD domain-containing protein [Echinicola soli]QDH80020.1 hypothetical protein FKX85_13650 [Echinicola soli]
MKKQAIYLFSSMLLICMVAMSCNDNDEDPKPIEQKKVYTLNQVGDSGVMGTVTFTKQNDDFTMVSIELEGTMDGDMHPSHIHANSASEGGGILIDLTSVDGETGKSETSVTQLNDGTPITYQELIAFDGYVNVHKSPSELSTLLAQGNIGSNVGSSSGNGGGSY